MPQQVRYRQQGKQVGFSANNRVTADMSRGMVYRELFIRLRGQPTIAAIDNTSANTQRGDAWGVIKKIEVVANGNDTLKSLDGNALWWLNYFLYGQTPRISAIIADAATVNPAFDVGLILPFWMPRAVSPMDTALDSRNLSSLEIAITWGDYTDINSAATGWTAEPTIDVWSLESFNISGPFSVWRIHDIEKTITATSSRFQVQLPIGRMYRGFLINTTVGGVDVSNVLNNFKLVSGTTVFADISAGDNVLQQWVAERLNLPRNFNTTNNAYDPLRRGDANDVTGWVWYEQVTDGLLSESIDTLGFSELTMDLDVTVGGGTTKINILPMEITPVRGNTG